jgi:quercetin dioxygenase-like cupin family protein
MAGSVASSETYGFDDRNVRWHKFGDFKHFVFAMLDVDERRKIVDLIVKFEPNKQIFLHTHRAVANLFVVQGEHRIYEPNGEIKTIRPAGSYTASPLGDTHREGGGSEGCVVLYSFRVDDDILFDVLDDDLNVVASLRMQDFADALKEQRPA